MKAKYIDISNIDISALEANLLNENRELQVVPASFFKDFSQEQLMYFCHKYAFYQLPTTELISFLKSEIGDHSAIEIGSGNGVFGRSLGIPATDSYIQATPLIKAYYETLGHPVINYGSNVEKLEGVEAVEKYQPQVVIGSWVTQWGASPATLNSSFVGIKENLIMGFPSVKKYIVIGNEDVHKGKMIALTHKVRELRFPWLISKAINPSKNLIYIFFTNN